MEPITWKSTFEFILIFLFLLAGLFVAAWFVGNYYAVTRKKKEVKRKLKT